MEAYHGSVDHKMPHELAMRLREYDGEMARAHLGCLVGPAIGLEQVGTFRGFRALSDPV
jgi:hypothetical protein